MRCHRGLFPGSGGCLSRQVFFVFSGAGMTMATAETYTSVLFATVSGSARLQEKLGSAEASRAVDRCLKRVERAVGAFGGRMVKSVENEPMAVFSTADEAVQAALEMQQRVGDLPPVSGIKLAIRIGFAFGQVLEADGNYGGEAVVAAAHLAGFAAPGQILTNEHALTVLSPQFSAAARELELTGMKRHLSGGRIFEVQIAESHASLTTAVLAPGAEAVPQIKTGMQSSVRLRLSHAGLIIVLDDTHGRVTLGRGVECDVLVHDARASRKHARIELRDGRFILSDTSTNGTFVTLSGLPEMKLHREECVLRSKGVISFASSAESPGADIAEFEELFPE